MFDSLRHIVGRWIAPELRILGISPRVDPSFNAGIFNRASRAGPNVNERSALGITAFWRGVNLYASTISALKLEVVERNDRGGSSPAPNHPIYDLLHTRPNKTTPRVHFWQALITHALTYKGGFAEIEWSARGRQPLALHIMDPRSVTPVLNEDRSVQYKIDSMGTLLDSSDVIHIRGLGWNGIDGYSLVDLFRETLGVAQAQLIHEGSVFGNGAQMGGIIEVPTRLDAQRQAELRDSINAVHQGPDKSGVLGILTAGAKYVPTNYSPADTQLILSRRFAVAEVSRLMGIPPHMLGEMDGATVGNAEQQALQFVKFSLQPWLRAIENELDLKLLSPQERRRFSTWHDTKSLERGDLAARTAYHRAMFEMGTESINEIRLAEGLNPIDDPGGDWNWISTNNKFPVQKMGEDFAIPTAPTTGKPAEEPSDGADPQPATASDAA
jgi:HK97 family phage portal protein